MSRLELKSADGTLLNGRTWAPEAAPKGNVVVCHGVAEHIGRYEFVANRLTAAGFRVTAIDWRGHGHSGGKRGVISVWEDYVADMRAAVATIDGPYAILAHSMGSAIALDYLRSPDANVCAVCAIAPPLVVPADVPRWKILAGRALSRVLPNVGIPSEVHPSAICTDAAVVQKYLDDPLVFRFLTTRWFTEMVKAQERIRAHAPHYKQPLLCMWGESDTVVEVDSIPPFLARYGGEVASQTWPNLYHEILNEPVKDKVMDKIIAFMEAHCAKD